MNFSTVHPSDQEIFDWLQLDTDNAVIAGGAALRWWQNQPVAFADIDIFFNGHAAFQRQLDLIMNNTQVEVVKSKTSIIDKLDQFFQIDCDSKLVKKITSVQMVCDSANAVTLRVTLHDGKQYRVQLIKNKYHANIIELLDRFDITVCRIATDGTRWWTGEHFHQDQKSKTLRLMRTSPNTLKRVIKYMSYGYQIDSSSWHMLQTDPHVLWDFQDQSEEDYHEQ